VRVDLFRLFLLLSCGGLVGRGVGVFDIVTANLLARRVHRVSRLLSTPLDFDR